MQIGHSRLQWSVTSTIADGLGMYWRSEKELRRSVKVFKKGFDGLLTYAVKCNPSPHILQQLYREGVEWYRRYGVSDRPMPEDWYAFKDPRQFYYGAYVLHQPLVELAKLIVPAERIGASGVVGLVALVIVTMAAAWAATRWIDTPARKWVRRRLRAQPDRAIPMLTTSSPAAR